ncbi:TasA family protein [Candidatus Blastococcus massiliensis]|uniref:TasA family protein n=1 Tax=Candidatus Blastococcus massiliensis TaxID=1470358 RepID=UPI0004B000F2|nr:TasA family protein [Candidatus Blastococcus massiliensis]
MSAKVTSTTARKVIGSLGVIGAAAAVAGMGTFGAFTDSSTPVATTISSGTVSIDLTQPSPIAFNASGLVPGDTVTRPMTLKNDGNTPLSTVSLTSTATVGSVLTTDTTNGLQLAVKACPTAYVQGGTTLAPTFTCASGERTVLTGPAVTMNALNNPNSLTPGGTDYLAVSFTLPASADNGFQNKSATLSLVFTGTQRTAGTR